jgi:4-hydroxy-tetrahydrodipicolinate synthase
VTRAGAAAPIGARPDDGGEMMSQPLRFEGVMPANLLPFTAALEIDEPAYRRHLRWLADVRGVTGLVVNGHAAEVSSLDREERRRALAIALDEVAGQCPVIAGVYTDGTREAVRLARDARGEGAAGILLFPPTLFMWGAQVKPEMVIRHVSEVAAGADLPIVVFEYPPASGIGYAPETLARLAEIPQVAAVKDWSNDIVAFERNLRAVRATNRPVSVLSSFTLSLMASFLLGADGAISGMGSVVADVQAALFDACRKGDLEEARRLTDRLDPLVRVFYAPPFVDMHNRMKEALALLGRIPATHVRPPLTPIPESERQAIRRALAAAGVSA